jgi:ferrochelatase
MEHLGRAARRLGMPWVEASSYAAGEGFIEALVDGIRPVLDGADHLVLTAHGLPRRVVQAGDPYVDQVRQTVAALKLRLAGEVPCSLAFQSRLGPVAWVGPHLDDEIRRLADGGVRCLAVAPVSFACENLETLWDLDREMARLAADCGISCYRRAPAPGCRPGFIDQLARQALDAAGRAVWVTGRTEDGVPHVA